LCRVSGAKNPLSFLRGKYSDSFLGVIMPPKVKRMQKTPGGKKEDYSYKTRLPAAQKGTETTGRLKYEGLV
jgi:hypothetical protein